jgi:hypothetical protein
MKTEYYPKDPLRQYDNHVPGPGSCKWNRMQIGRRRSLQLRRGRILRGGRRLDVLEGVPRGWNSLDRLSLGLEASSFMLIKLSFFRVWKSKAMNLSSFLLSSFISRYCFTNILDKHIQIIYH